MSFGKRIWPAIKAEIKGKSAGKMFITLIPVLRSNKCTLTVAWKHVFCEESISEVEITRKFCSRGDVYFLSCRETHHQNESGLQLSQQAPGKLGFTHLPCLFPGSSSHPQTLVPIYLMKRMCWWDGLSEYFSLLRPFSSWGKSI